MDKALHWAEYIHFKLSGDEFYATLPAMSYQGLLHKYGHLLDLPPHTQPVSLLEGNTPLIKAEALSRQLGGGFELFIKYEGLNPTGSFKDRGMTAAISEALGSGANTVICASTGNTAASAAAYAARAGMKSIVLIPQGKVAAGKLAGAVAYGAQVIQIDGSFDDALTLVVEITNRHPICLVNSINPYRIEGQKTSAFEICDVLESAPDWLCLPVGNAGNITSYWAGFQQYNELKATGLPQVLGVQAAGSAPLVVGHPVENPETVATAIRIGKPARGEQALQAAEESHGRIIAATDEQILHMQKTLATLEGIWVEPASAAGLAGLALEIESGRLKGTGKRVVAICTGHGLKDPDIITRDMQKPHLVPPKLHALEEIILR
jgi:threonine synthase